MRSVFAPALIILAAIPAQADESCTAAVQRAMQLTVVTTATLATATTYMTSHDERCDGTALSLQQDDGAAVDKAWFAAIDAQTACTSNDQYQIQLSKLIQALHSRRIRIDGQIAALHRKCD